MSRLGFIGYGSMGRMLISSFIRSGAVKSENIIITRKDKSRLGEIKDEWHGIKTAQGAEEVVGESQYVFICVKPAEFKGVLAEIKPYILPDHHIISIAGSVTIGDIGKFAACRITRAIPTIISEVNEGITLVCHNREVIGKDADNIESLLGAVSKIKRVDEKQIGIASEYTSCGPGLIAAIFNKFVEAGLRHDDSFGRHDVVEMLLQTVYGTARLMLEEKMDFDDLISRVATKGGITEEGVKVLEEGLPHVFDEMFVQTLSKRKIVSEKVHREFEA